MSSKKNKPKPANLPKPTSSSASRLPRLWPTGLVIAAFSFLLYANTLGYDYVLDDFSVIKENFVTKRGFDGIPDLWTHHSRYGYWNSSGELYRPIPMTMFAVEWALAPDTPALGHVINVLLYALSGALLFVTLARWMRGYHLLLPLLTTLFFMAHPAHVEVVANIKSRDEIVMFGLAVLALNFLWKYLETNKLSALLLSLASYTLALFSKENAVTFVAIVPLMMYFFTKKSLPKIARTTAFYVIPALLFVLVRRAVIGSLTNPSEIYVMDNILAGAQGAAYYANAFLVLGKYLWTLLVPYPLCSDFGFNQIPLTDWGDWRVLLSLAVWTGIGIFGLLRLRRRDLWAFAILFFFINFSIFTNLFLTIGTSYGDRLLYSASPGFALALALVLMKIFKVETAAPKAENFSFLAQKKGLLAVAGVVLLAYSVLTFSRNFAWKDSYTLYDTDIETAPNSAKLNFHYGLEIVQKGLKATDPQEQKAYYDRAKQRFEHALQIFPAYHDAYSQLGLAYYREKNYDKALENYSLALKFKANFPLVYSNMGIIYFERGDLVKAKEVYEKAVQYDPRMVDALRNLGAVNAMQKNFPEAIKWFKQGLQYDPENPTLNFYLGSAYKDSGQPELGKPFLEKAYRLDPKLKK
ncbi:MAG: tetratricopeptide repeat protein [Bacteroidetes bacterium]|nr:tetratricopeptide repeat protein [Bacteroidota bacterium]